MFIEIPNYSNSTPFATHRLRTMPVFKNTAGMTISLLTVNRGAGASEPSTRNSAQICNPLYLVSRLIRIYFFETILFWHGISLKLQPITLQIMLLTKVGGYPMDVSSFS